MNDRKTVTFFLLFLGGLICFSSCASRTSVRESRFYAYLTNNSKYILLPAECIENPIDMAQQISVSYGGRDYFFAAWVKADEKGIDMTIFNEMGSTMGELSYRKGDISFSSPVFHQTTRAEYIVADFQICFYDAAALRQALENCGLSLESSETDRRIYQKESLIIEVEKSFGSVRFVNHLRGYTYTLKGEFE